MLLLPALLDPKDKLWAEGDVKAQKKQQQNNETPLFCDFSRRRGELASRSQHIMIGDACCDGVLSYQKRVIFGDKNAKFQIRNC